MEALNTNDYKILNAIVDEKRNIGINRLRGITVVELSESTGLSTSKARGALKKLLERNFVQKGVKRVRSETFYITEEGIKELIDVTQVVKGLEFNDEAFEDDVVEEVVEEEE